MKSKKTIALLDEIRRYKRQCAVHDTTFAPGGDDKEKLAKWFADGFDLWWDSWIEPKLAEIEAMASGHATVPRWVDENDG